MLTPLFTQNYFRFMLLAGILVLQGCASMSKEECLTVNWYDKGRQDGAAGYTSARVENHREACSSVGVIPNVMQYNQGYNQGILLYCTPEKGLSEGRAGQTYRNVCPPHLESGFLDNYRRGKRVYDAQQRVDSLSRESNSLEYSLTKEKNGDKRRRLRRRLHDLDWQLRNARDDLYHAERQLRY